MYYLTVIYASTEQPCILIFDFNVNRLYQINKRCCAMSEFCDLYFPFYEINSIF